MSTNEHQAHGLLLQEVCKSRADMVEAANKLRPRPDIRAQLERINQDRALERAKRGSWLDRFIRWAFRM
jgi:hypothetical protein